MANKAGETMMIRPWAGILGLGVLLQVLSLPPVSAQGRRFEGPLETVPLRGSVYMMVMEPAGNLGVSAGADGAFVIDDQFAPMTERIIAAVAELTDQPIAFVANTHWHGDHSGSNENLGRMGYAIVAHENVRARLNSIQYHLFFKTGTRPRPPDALPVITYDDRMTFYLNDEVIEVIHVPVAHTDGDSAFYFREANVLHTGDAFINRGYPLIDIASGGTLKGVIEAANQMLEIVDDETIIIPGHGPLADRARMIEIRDMLADARARVVALIDQGMSLAEIKAAKPLATLDPEWGQALIKGRAFVTIIYQSETGDWNIPAEITRWNQ